MILTPAAYDEAVYSSHELYTEVRVLGQGGDDTVIYPDGGSVTLDLTAAVRGNCQLQFSDPDLIPMDASDPLAPFGNELQVSRGLRTPDGFEHLVPLGIFIIQDTAVTASATGINIDVTASDRAQGAIDAVFEADFSIAGGQDYTDTILSVVSGGVTVAETDFITMTGSTTTSPGFQGDDRWAFAQDMAAFIGCDLYLVEHGRPDPEADQHDWQLSGRGNHRGRGRRRGLPEPARHLAHLVTARGAQQVDRGRRQSRRCDRDGPPPAAGNRNRRRPDQPDLLLRAVRPQAGDLAFARSSRTPRRRPMPPRARRRRKSG